MSKIVVVIETDEQVKTVAELTNLLNGLECGSVEAKVTIDSKVKDKLTELYNDCPNIRGHSGIYLDGQITNILNIIS